MRPADLMQSGGVFDLPRKATEIEKLEAIAAEPDFWNDPSEAQKLYRKLSVLKSSIGPVQELAKNLSDILEYYQLLELESDPATEKEAKSLAIKFLKDLDQFELETMLSGEHDGRNAIIEIGAGAGGSEACDWASMLFRILERWAERKGYKLEIMSETPGDVVGFRNIQFEIIGPNAFGYLKSEHGVHRLVRISPFDANARRHTSFAKIEILAEIEENEVEIDPSDLHVETLRAGGAGGQHVNKTESAVRITHIPSGLVVQCQNERSQHKNRASAMSVLRARLKELQSSEKTEREQALKNEGGPASWGRQIRSYVMQPYTLVKDHRTGYETGNVLGVLDGDIDGFIEAYLKRSPDSETFIE